MSSPQAQGNAQVQALLQRVTEDRDRRCAAFRAAAADQARQIVRSARAEARKSVGNAVMQARARMDLEMRIAKARADIEVRRRERQKSQELLDQMWAALGGGLESRWREPSLRRAWIDAAMSQAGALLAGRAWLIEVGSECTEQERGELTERARGRGAGPVEWSPQAAIRAGLKIRAAGVCVDATVAGLLIERDTVEAAFLAEYVPALAGGDAPVQTAIAIATGAGTATATGKPAVPAMEKVSDG